MKHGEYQVKRKNVADTINEKGLVKKCVDVALQGEMIHKKERDSWATHVKWEFNSPDGIYIFHEDGCYNMGDGEELTVKENGKIVFQVYDETFLKKKGKENQSIPLNNRDFVTVYKTGNWEKVIDKYKKDVPKAVVDKFEDSFKI